jgi:hypothetical protein
VKGANSVFKLYLQVSTEDLKAIYDKTTLLLTNQHIKYNEAISYNHTWTLHTANNTFYS